MELIWKIPLIVVVGYFLGNIQTGVIISMAFGHFDIRKHGSNNSGTTNVLRTMGWFPSVLTLLGDVAKAALASCIGLWLCGGWEGWGSWGARLGGLAAIIGHNWPALYGFKGGKGMAASLGMILVIEPVWIGLALVVCQVIVVAISHTMSIASLVSAFAYTVLTAITRWGQWPEIIFAAVTTSLAFLRHQGNIDRILGNRENRLNFKEIEKKSVEFISKIRKEKE